MSVEVERVEGSAIGFIWRILQLRFRRQKRSYLVWRHRAKTEIKRDDLRLSYEEDLLEATSQKERDEIGLKVAPDLAELDEILARLTSLRLLEKGKLYHIYRDDPSEWEMGAFGTYKMTKLAIAKYAQAVKVAEHEQFKKEADRRDSLIRLVTALGAGIGAAMGILNFFRS